MFHRVLVALARALLQILHSSHPDQELLDTYSVLAGTKRQAMSSHVEKHGLCTIARAKEMFSL